MRVGFPIPPVTKFKEAGILHGLGTDSTALTGNADLFSVMKLMLNLGDGMKENTRYMKPLDLIKSVTIDGAKIMNKDNISGSLTPGKNADLIMFKMNKIAFSSNPYNEEHLVVTAGGPACVDFVCSKGKILKQNGELVYIDEQAIIAEAEETLMKLIKRL